MSSSLPQRCCRCRSRRPPPRDKWQALTKKGSRRDDGEQSDRAQDFDHKQQQGMREDAPARPVPTLGIKRLKLARFDLV
jgi:hypothetical protein